MPAIVGPSFAEWSALGLRELTVAYGNSELGSASV